jgi:hypothetical protein
VPKEMVGQPVSVKVDFDLAPIEVKSAPVDAQL